MYVLGNKLPNGYFASFETLTDEQAKQALLDAWSTPEQQIYNLMHRTCGTCNGRGYKVERDRRGRVIAAENVGCTTCHGTGAIPLEFPLTGAVVK